MTQKKFFLFLIGIGFFLFLGFFPLKVFAEGTGSYSISCMRADATYKPACIPEKPCIDFPEGKNHPDSSKPDHEFRLMGSGFPTDAQIYIVGCVQTSENLACTTGNEATDDKVRELGFQIQKDPAHEFAVSEGNPVTPLADGSLSIIIRSYTPNGTAHSFYGVYATPTSQTGGSSQTLQYGTFEFAQDASKCISIHWDPEGRIFDSKSLEPIPETTMRLLNSKKELAIGIPGVIPEIKTLLGGVFNFFAPNGTYFLQPSKTGYQFPVSMSQIHANYARAYSCDPIVAHPLYNDQYPLVEKDKIIHCDVPLDPGANAPYRADVKTVTYEQVIIPGSISVKYGGQVSHPLTIVTLVGETTGKLVKTITADKYGFWETSVPNSDVPKKANGLPDKLVAMYTKVDLTSNQTTKIQTKGIIFEPIPRYVEGYAYNQNGVPLPFAQVAVVVDRSGLIQSQTKTDEKGFFAIPSQNLPIFNYSLEVKSSTGSAPILYTMSEFMEKNKDYLTANNVDLLGATKNNAPIVLSSANITPGGGFSTGSSFMKYGGKNAESGTPSSQQKTQNEMFVTAILIIFLLITGIVGGIVFYMKKRSSANPLS